MRKIFGKDIKFIPLTKVKFNEAIEVVLRAGLDTREEIEYHLKHIDAHFVALDKNKVIGVIGWYQDNVNYATKAMGDRFPGEEAYWVGFFAVDENYQGKSVGYNLFKILETDLKKKKVNKLWVSSVPETKSYYERQGFKLVMEGEINGNRKYFMMKDLSYVR